MIDFFFIILWLLIINTILAGIIHTYLSNSLYLYLKKYHKSLWKNFMVISSQSLGIPNVLKFYKYVYNNTGNKQILSYKKRIRFWIKYMLILLLLIILWFFLVISLCTGGGLRCQ